MTKERKYCNNRTFVYKTEKLHTLEDTYCHCS